MKNSRRFASAVLAPLAVAALSTATRSTAQAPVIPPSTAQGLASNMPVGLSVYGTNPNDSVRVRAPGTASGQPVAWTSAWFSAASALHPDYSTTALTAHWVPASIARPQFGGISTGGERMPPVDPDGVLDMSGFDNWFALAVTVDRNAHGLPGSMVDALSAQGRQPGGDIFAYYVSDSQAIHPDFPHTVRLEYSREQLQLSPTPQVDGVIDNVDFGIGVISVDPLNRAGNMFPVRDLFYFTLTKTWIALAASGVTIQGAQPNAATVYAMKWSGTAWSAPEVVFTPNDLLGSTVAAGSVEIDALSVDASSAQWLTPSHVVFSLTLASNSASGSGGPYDQLLVYSGATSGFAKTLKAKESSHGPARPITQHLGLKPVDTTIGEPDNVTSTCGLDPVEPYRLGAVVGLATDETFHGAGDLGFTAIRTDTPQDAPNADTLHLQVTGLDFTPYALGFIEFALEAPAGQPQASTPWGSPYWITPHAALINRLDVPVSVDTKPLDDTRMAVRLSGLDTTTMTLVPLRESWVIGFKL